MRLGRAGFLTVVGLVLCLESVATSVVKAQSGPLIAHAAGHETQISPEDVEALAAAQRALIEARALSAQLDEHAALQKLLLAERGLREILHVPSVHRWLAEVWLQMGIIAAQRGEMSLAQSLLSRALSLDVSREVGAAEAAPKIVALVASLARERDGALRSRFRVEASPAEATLWIDGRERGRGAIELDLAPGPHLLRITAPQHTTYAAVIEAWSGTRAPVFVALSETPAAEALRLAAGPTAIETPTPNAEQRELPREPAQREKPRWWRRWPTWASAAVIVAAGAVTLALAVRDDDRVTERRLRVDPGPTNP